MNRRHILLEASAQPTPEVKGMRSDLRVVSFVLIGAILALACAAVSAPTATPTATPPSTLIPADADSPAAGICGLMEGEWVTFTVSLDVPSPRCAQLRPSQRLEISNPTPAAVVVTFAGQDFSIEAGNNVRIDEPLGSYLAPGVHDIYVTQGSGNLPELWLLPE